MLDRDEISEWIEMQRQPIDGRLYLTKGGMGIHQTRLITPFQPH